MSKQPKPDSKQYADLISEINKGEIKVPKFQRDFVWSIEKTAKLLDSILKGYPIGTFILWETNERLNDIKNIGDLKLPQTPEGSKVQYVLDGQQRITSLYAAYLGAKIRKEGEKKVTDYKNIYVSLEKDIDGDEEIVVSEKPENLHISLHQILNSEQYFDYIEDNFEKEYRKKINQYSTMFSTYDFSTVVLRKEDIDSAIEVFTRINTGGATLTLFEIMSAKTYDEGQKFDMEDKFQKLLEELSESKFNTISSSVILSILSLVLSKSKECKRKTILQLNKQQIIDTWDEVIDALKSSIDYFRSVFRIPVSALLPYDSLLVPFSYFFYVKKDSPTGVQVEYLEEFFWRMSLSYRYSSASESKLAQDIKRIEKILINERPEYNDINVNLDSYKTLIDTSFSAGSSYCKAILCLMAYHEPKDFQHNGKVNLDNSNLKAANSKNYHHFFPKAYLKNEKIANENSLVNISLVSAELNKRKIKAKAPSIYIQNFWDENDELPVTLKSHIIDDLDEFGIISDDYNVFLEKRAKAIYNELDNRINLKHKESAKDIEIRELLSKGESDKLEFKSTMRFDIRNGTINKKMEFIIAKAISSFLNSDGGTLVIGADDDGNILGLDKDLSTLDKSNLDGFELHLHNLIKKYLSSSFEKHIKIRFSNIDDKDICIVHVMKNGKPVFVKYENDEKFYVRNGNSSIPKSPSEQMEYIKLHWG